MAGLENKIILIVDDSPLQAIVLRRILTQTKFETLTAKDGEEALNILKSKHVDLVISDVNMPKIDGYELCRRMKAETELAKIPIILCTVLSSPEDLMRGIEIGADSYVTRPYNDEHILQVVNDLISIPRQTQGQAKETIVFEGKTYSISAGRQHILNFLLSTYSNIHRQNRELVYLREEIQKAYIKLESTQKEQEQLLLNMLPESVANELIAYGSVQPHRFEHTTVMFVDFKGFSKISASLSPDELVQILSYFFDEFDKIVEEFKLERIKTIGDGYMCASGISTTDPGHAIRCVGAALEIMKFVNSSVAYTKEKYNVDFKARIGIHSGPVVAGVVGKKRFAYDIWGDTVNIASRMESCGIAGEINISNDTYELVKGIYKAKSRGSQPIRNKEGVERYSEMYLVEQPRTL